MSVLRMKTRAVAVVHSHVRHTEDNGVIDLSNDVIAIQTKKSIKGPGAASLTIVPRRNYFNLIYPNDIINIYFDPGDGKRGLVRTFFGYVDRIERSVTTDDKGATTTNFRITCTDVTKVFDRTDIYFNPNLANRTDFLETRFGNSLLGGHALRTRGIRAHGTPSDMIENLASLLLGFGAQWTLPESYKDASTGIQKNRERRINRTEARVSNSDAVRFAELGGNTQNLDELDNDIQGLTLKVEEAIKEGQYISSLVKVELERKKALAKLLEGNETFSAFRTISKEAGEFNHTVLDLLDLSFIEAMAIDGYIASTAVWQKQGSLASLMYGYSNEMVNELFFDLRPVMEDEGKGLADSCFGHKYSTEPDELGINTGGLQPNFPASVKAVKYSPAIIMREYPYSTSQGIDLSHLFVSDVGGQFGFVPFGPIFSQEVNPPEPVRAIYDYSVVPQVAELGGLSPNSKLFKDISKPLKHLDVIPITSQDVRQETVGRADHDIFNLLAISAENPLQNVWKYLTQDLFPIVTPVSIERNGLRLMELSTMYANYSQDNLDGRGSGIDNNAIRRNLTRWAFLLDHWNQHNNEYLSGDFTLRGMPEIRVGYRLDYVDRHESYYVEEVSHNWSYPDAMQTQVTVSRGQRNDPMPAYVPPAVSRNFGQPTSLEEAVELNRTAGVSTRIARAGTLDSPFSISILDSNELSPDARVNFSGGDRSDKGRLGKYFHVNPTHATRTTTKTTTEDRRFEERNYLDSHKDGTGRTLEYSDQEGPAQPVGFVDDVEE